MLDYYLKASSPGNILLLHQLGNAANRVPNDATAFGHRGAKWAFVIISCWADPSESEVHFAWSREVRQATAPYATGGVYVNNIGRQGEGGAESVSSAYGGNYARLAEVKKRYDPGNLFRHNQNIAPAP
jgi:FAD/FMN-containing dehydrogenase